MSPGAEKRRRKTADSRQSAAIVECGVLLALGATEAPELCGAQECLEDSVSGAASFSRDAGRSRSSLLSREPIIEKSGETPALPGRQCKVFLMLKAEYASCCLNRLGELDFLNLRIASLALTGQPWAKRAKPLSVPRGGYQ